MLYVAVLAAIQSLLRLRLPVNRALPSGGFHYYAIPCHDGQAEGDPLIPCIEE